MIGIRIEPNADRVLVAAPTRGGKTTLIRYIVACLQPVRVVLIDPKEAPELADIPNIVHDTSDLPEALREPICHWVPADMEDWKDVCLGYRHIWALHKHGPRVVWDDEVADTTKPNRIAPACAMLIRRGSGWRQVYIAATQRLSEAHGLVRTQCKHIIAMTPAPVDLDLESLARHVQMNPRQLQEALNDLCDEAGPYSHLWFCEDDRELPYRRMAACPPPPYDWPRRSTAVKNAQPSAPVESDDQDAPSSDDNGTTALEDGVPESPPR